MFFQICGAVLTATGFLLFIDGKKILLSRLLVANSERLNDLPQPLFYYLAIGLITAGVVAVFASIIGIWSTCLNTYCYLSIYFLMVVILLLAESVVCLSITLWPHCLGISLDESKIVKSLQGFYGLPGKEQFTIAIDLAQTQFGCCGMNSELNYDTSLWRLQGYGQRDWAVPLTCCILENENDPISYLDPKPVNESQCQSVERSIFEHYRYVEPCLKHLEKWYLNHYALFLVASLVIALVEFTVLFSIIFTCTKHTKQNENEGKIIRGTTGKRTESIPVENVYETTLDRNSSSNTFDILDLKESFVQPRNLYKHRHSTSFKPTTKDLLPPLDYLS